jgi:HSP20 family protein
MAMEQWSPFRDMMTLRDAMDRLFQESFVRPANALLGRGAPALDLRETENGYEIEAALPGVKPEDVQITVQGDTLTIRGETKAEEERKDQNWILRERHSGAFYRTVTLPTPVNADQAQARFEHGVLHLTLPKAEEAKPRQIRIGDGGQARQIPMQGTSAPPMEQTH